jgi:predicted ATPase
LIAERSEGNPFYIEELIKMLIDDGVITVDDLSWQVALEKLAEVRIPETLTAVLQASLDSLSEDERETLQRAAVVGLVFWDDALNFLAAERRLVDPDGLQEMTAGTLQTLKNKGLIIQHKDTAFADTEEYSFKNTMLHQVTYESVLRRTRRSYHERTAEWLISQWGERAEENAATIAGHYEQAEAAAEAAEWFGRAARQAHETHTFRAALEYYQKGLDLLASHPEATPAQRIPLYGGLAEMLRRHTRYDEALE